MNQWVEFFTNNSLVVNNITIKFRTNVLMENYNSKLKNL